MSSVNDTAASSGRGYWVVFASVSDMQQFGQYTAFAAPVIQSHGGRVLARGDVAQGVEGTLPGRPFLIEFPSYERALACFASDEYQHAISLRAGAAEFRIVVMAGVEPAP